MIHFFGFIKRRILCLSVCATLSMVSACGFERLEPELPDLVAGLTLTQLAEIQNDERLTADEQRARIREAIGAPVTASGDRLVEFLLNLNVP